MTEMAPQPQPEHERALEDRPMRQLEPDEGEPPVADRLWLRYIGTKKDGNPIRELPASDVAEVLEGLVGLNEEFGKAGAFGEGPPPRLVVRPAREGSFILEVVQVVQDVVTSDQGIVGAPGLSAIIWWATRSYRADVKDFDLLENGNVKVVWQDDTAEEIPRPAWDELNKRKQRRKRHLRKIMAPMSDAQITAVQVRDVDGVTPPTDEAEAEGAVSAPEHFTLERTDYRLVRPEDEAFEDSSIFETEAQMVTVDFETAGKWRVRTPRATRNATVEDADFLSRIDKGLSVSKGDTFDLKIREDRVTKNGRTRRTWTVLEVTGPRKGSVDGGDTQP